MTATATVVGSRTGTFTWLDGSVERVIVHVIRDGQAYVSWPDSIREIPALGPGKWQRPSGWVPADRVGVKA